MAHVALLCESVHSVEDEFCKQILNGCSADFINTLDPEEKTETEYEES